MLIAKWRETLSLYRDEILDPDRLKPHLIYTLLIGILMTGIWWHIFTIQLYIVLMCVGETLIFSTVIYLALATRNVLFARGTSTSSVMAFGLFMIVALFVGILAMHLANPLFVNSYTCGARCEMQIAEFHKNQTPFESLVFAVFLSSVFIIMGWAYQNVRTQLRLAMDHLRQKELNEQHLQRLKLQAELQALQASINPHFLYNTLNSIASLISISPPKAEEAVLLLSRLFRTSLQQSLDTRIPLAETLKQAELYIKLEKLRFGERLSYEIHYDPALAEIRVPVLLVQPLVENAIKHGIGPKVGGGHLTIHVRSVEDFAVISVMDNGLGWGVQPSLEGSGHGLANVRERLRLIYGPESKLEILCAQGVEVKLWIPLASVGA